MRRLIVAAIIATTIFLTASFGKPEEPGNAEAEDARPNALADVSATIAAVKAEATRVEGGRNYKAQVAAVLAEKQVEAKRKQALLAKAVASKAKAQSVQSVQSGQSGQTKQPSRSQDYVGKAQAFTATAYTSHCSGCSGITKTGVNLRQSIYHEGKRVIAVDPRYIPLGSIVRVTLSNGSSFEAIAEDIGGAIKGAIIDVAHETTQEAYVFGRQSVEVRLIRKGR